jgi:hypothetical protein
MGQGFHFFTVRLKSMQSPPYMLLLMGDEAGSCSIFDPAEGYRLIKGCGDYEEARLWLLEDEYEPIEGRLTGNEIS